MKKVMAISKLDKAIIGVISKDIPLVKEPFKELAGKLGIDEKVLIARMRLFKRTALMRRFSAILDHKKIGFRYNAMVVWRVPVKLVNKAGLIMASFSEVSHCYERERREGWDYDLYCMVHGRTRRACLTAIKKISEAIGPRIEHKALFSSKEEKKTGAEYFAK